MPVNADPELGRRSRVSTRTLLLACLPAIAVGLAVRVWLMRTSLAALNADEGVTGLQAFEVLRGRFRLVVAGNEYGSTTETYLLAPFLTFWTGVWPLRILPVALSALAGYAIYRLARPILGRVPAAVVGLVGWTTSGAVALIFLRAYMGYTTGFIAQVAALALACHAMRTDQKLARTAVLAGFAAGFAVWSHPVFGMVALLALVVPTLYRWRALRRWWLPLAVGGFLGASPWLLFMAQNGLPEPAAPTVATSYAERLLRFFTELLPRAFGLRTPGGAWVGPDSAAIWLAALLTSASLVGMVMLVVRKGKQALPILVAGALAFPFLAVLPPLGFVADGRYALPLLPQLLVGLGGWLMMVLPDRVRDSPWLLVTVPTVWAVLLSVPVIHEQVRWEWLDPNADAKQVARELDRRQIDYVDGDYWTSYLVDYLADGRLQAGVDVSVRLAADQAAVDAADPSQVAHLYYDGAPPRLRMPADRYERLDVGNYDLYLPVRS